MIQISNSKKEGSKYYDLEKRTFEFARNCRNFVKKLTQNSINTEYSKQLIRSSGSQAANYIEANEALSVKDFKHRVKICIKEVRESALWLSLCDFENNSLYAECKRLIQEAEELRRIFSAIFKKYP